MNAMTWLVVLVPVVALMAAFAGYFGARALATRTLGEAQGRAGRIVEDAKRLAEQARGDVEAKLREAETKVREA